MIALNKEKAPISVRNFPQYVRAGHYDGTVFHRVMPGFMVQGGGFTPEMKERPTRPDQERGQERPPKLARHPGHGPDQRPDSATSQFFINSGTTSGSIGSRGAGYAVFGKVVEGLEIADRTSLTPTTPRGPHQNAPQTSVVIRRAHELKTWAAKPAAEAPKP